VQVSPLALNGFSGYKSMQFGVSLEFSSWFQRLNEITYTGVHITIVGNDVTEKREWKVNKVEHNTENQKKDCYML
jgi:hypothetical protein